MAAYRRVYDSCHLQWLTAKNRDQLRNPTLGNRVWATFTFLESILRPIYCSDLDVGGISKRQREVVFLEQTEVLTDGVKQLLTLRRFLQPTTHTKIIIKGSDVVHLS